MKFTNDNKTTLFYILAATLLVSVLAAFYFRESVNHVIYLKNCVTLLVSNIPTFA